MGTSKRKPIRDSAGGSTMRPEVLIGVAGVLVGAGAAWMYAGFVQGAYAWLDPTPLTFRLATGAVLLATALGPRLPRRFAWRLASGARGWLEQSAAEPHSGKTSSAGADRALLWMVVGVVGLASSIAALAMPVWCKLACGVLQGGLEAFLWTDGLLTVFEAIVLLLAAVPFALIGFFIRCVHHLGCPAGRWSFGALIWVLVGLAVGLAATGFVRDAQFAGEFMLRGGAVPLLCVALIAVWQATPAPSRRRMQQTPDALVEPDVGQRWPVVLRVSVAVCVCATVTAGTIWIYVVWALGMGGAGSLPIAGGALLASAAGGVALAARWSAQSDHGIGTWGVQTAVAGVALAAGGAVFSLVIGVSYRGFIHGPGSWLLWLLCACVPVGVAGHVIGYGSLAVLRRSGFVSASGAVVLQTIFTGAAVACAFVALAALEILGSYATLVASALALLAMGGILVIHEPGARTPRARVTGVFAAVLLMIWLMPLAGRNWLSNREVARGRLVESWWVSVDGRARATMGEAAPAAARAMVDWRRLPMGARVGVVSLFGETLAEAPAGFQGRLHHLALVDDRGRLGGVGGGPEDERLAWRAWRAGTQRYDVLILLLADVPGSLRAQVLRGSTLQWVARRMSPDGVIVALVNENAGDVVSQASRTQSLLQTTFPDRAEVMVGGQTCLALYGGFGAGSRANAWRWSALPLASVDARASVRVPPGQNRGDDSGWSATADARRSAPVDYVRE